MSAFEFPLPADEGARIEAAIVGSVQRLRESGLWTPEEEVVATSVQPVIYVDMAETDAGFLKPLTGLYRNYDVIPPAPVASDRPLIGPVVGMAKRLMRMFLRFYVNRSLERQTGFNQASVSAHQRAMTEVAALRREVEELRMRLDAERGGGGGRTG